MKHIFTYEFNEYGYNISIDAEQVYSAGNHRHDSQIFLPKNDVDALSLREIEKMALSTLEEIKKEY